MKDFWKELGYRPAIQQIPRRLRASTRGYSLKQGPNGHALNTSMWDFKALPDDLKDSLCIMGGSSFCNKVIKPLNFFPLRDLLDVYHSYSNYVSKPSFRRLCAFSDKEGKTRVIGILDYFSQICLKPLHLYLGDTLSRIRQDCTLNQSNFKNLILNKDFYHSVDLTSATDRFPIFIIENLLKSQLPASYVDAWKKVMVGFPFDYQDTSCMYSTGNPMGAYSSFNSFALSHHYVIYYCCKKLGYS